MISPVCNIKNKTDEWGKQNKNKTGALATN